jgi:YegS/Rv2252/BmrU family lipid kinase
MTAAPRAVRLIVNPSAAGGRALRRLPAIEARLAALGVAFRTERTRDLPHARALAATAATGGEVPVTLGGDGLVGAVAGALREVAGAVLGVLPGGRGNDFARVLGLPLDPVAACDVVARGAPRPIDLGEADGRAFVGIASLGFDSEANRWANTAPPRLGRLVYLYGTLRALAAWRPAAFTVEVDGAEIGFAGWSVAAANTSTYGGGMALAPGARLDDGALDVVLVSATSRAHFLRALPRVFRGTHVGDPCVRMLRGAEVHVGADRPFVVYADGEPIGTVRPGATFTIRALPAALRVLAPPA